jgi:hypothetical protein
MGMGDESHIMEKFAHKYHITEKHKPRVYSEIRRLAKIFNVPEDDFKDKLPDLKAIQDVVAYSVTKNCIIIDPALLLINEYGDFLAEEGTHFLRNLYHSDSIDVSEFFGGLARLINNGGDIRVKLSSEEKVEFLDDLKKVEESEDPLEISGLSEKIEERLDVLMHEWGYNRAQKLYDLGLAEKFLDRFPDIIKKPSKTVKLLVTSYLFLHPDSWKAIGKGMIDILRSSED